MPPASVAPPRRRGRWVFSIGLIFFVLMAISFSGVLSPKLPDSYVRDVSAEIGKFEDKLETLTKELKSMDEMEEKNTFVDRVLSDPARVNSDTVTKVHIAAPAS
mmetsp:Transcript_1914/g.5766  ORF Transcript_1914/g.5766 Transcript_1914/m.5766 type:complete len:104 (+) Transcript_1914:62-373(+)